MRHRKTDQGVDVISHYQIVVTEHGQQDIIQLVSSTIFEYAAHNNPAKQTNFQLFTRYILCNLWLRIALNQHPQLLFTPWKPLLNTWTCPSPSHSAAHISLFPPTLSFSTKTRTSLSLSAAQICVECRRTRGAHRLRAFAPSANVAHFSEQFSSALPFYAPICRRLKCNY